MSKSPTGAPRRVAVGLLAGALSVFGIALAPQAGAVTNATFDRVAGATRYGTASAVSTEAYPDGNDCVIIATGERFPDSLAASGLAGAMECPILLVQLDDVPEETVAGLEDLGASSATIVGGTAAVSEDVEASLEADHGLTVNRIAGVDRYATAGAIADAIDDIADSDVAIVASGDVAADALAAGPVAAALDAPILLARVDDVPAATSEALAGRSEVLVAGGTARISNATEEDIAEASDDADPLRLAGLDRQETAAIIAEQYEVGTLAWAPETVMLAAPNAPNDDFSPDALVAGPLGGIRQAPTLIVDSSTVLGEDAEEFIDAHSNTITEVLCIGGTAVLSEELCTAARTAAQTTENDAPAAGASQTQVLDGPELQSCSVAGLDLGDLEIVYAYTFDEDIDEDTVDTSAFKLYNTDTRSFASGDEADADEDVDGAVVEITYSLLNYGVSDARLCAITDDAVEDEDGNAAPPQSIGIGTDINGAGNTIGPDLVSAEVTDDDTTTADDDEWKVTYTFDSPIQCSDIDLDGDDVVDIPGAFACDPADFQVVLRGGEVVSGTAIENTPEDDEASTTVEVTFAEGDFPDGEDTEDIVRAVIVDGAYVFGTYTQAADISRGGNSEAPDLVSVSTDADDDTATFTFDEDIATLFDGDSASSFILYYRECAGTAPFFSSPLGSDCQVRGVSGAPDEDDGEGRSVTIQFPDNSINELLVGASIEGGAVLSSDDDPTEANAPDEVNIPATFEAGEVAGPQLEGVEINADEDASGDFSDFEVVFTFDRDLDEDIDPTGFAIWYDDGSSGTTREDLSDCDVDDNTVTCTDDDEDSPIQDALVASVDYEAVFTAEEFTIGSDAGDVDTQFPNPEASFEASLADEA